MPAWFCQKQVMEVPEDWAFAFFLFNIMFPGSGTIASAACSKDHQCRWDVVGVGCAQILTTPLLLFGWAWSINHGAAIMDISKREDSEESGQ
jgi:hypothetical protein